MTISNYEVILTDVAKEELEKIYEYISEKLVEKPAADRLMEKIEKNILRLEQNPYSCEEIYTKPHSEVYRKLIIDNYIALYKVYDECKKVVIYRIVYGKMDYLENL